VAIAITAGSSRCCSCCTIAAVAVAIAIAIAACAGASAPGHVPYALQAKPVLPDDLQAQPNHNTAATAASSCS
jgi:hypothetical protein